LDKVSEQIDIWNQIERINRDFYFEICIIHIFED